MVEKRTTKYLPTKRLVVAMGSGLYRATTKFFPRNSLNLDFHENFAPQNTVYACVHEMKVLVIVPYVYIQEREALNYFMQNAGVLFSKVS